MITKSNVSTETIKSILDAAFLTCEIDGDGDILIDQNFYTYITFNPVYVSIVSLVSVNLEATFEALLGAANATNLEYLVPKVSILSREDSMTVRFQTVIPIGDGISPRTVVDSLRRSESAIRSVIDDNFKDLIN